MNSISAGQQFRAGRDRFLNLLVHALQNLFSRERPDLSRLIQRIADFQRTHAFNKLPNKFVVNLVRDEKPLRRDARLATVNCPCFDCGAERGFEIGARHHNERIAPAEFEHTFLDVPRGEAGNRASRFFAASERYRRHP